MQMCEYQGVRRTQKRVYKYVCVCVCERERERERERRGEHVYISFCVRV